MVYVMKKIVFILTAVVAFAFTACTKSNEPVKNEGIKLNIKVAAPEGETKAMKKNWANGDKINIWFYDITMYDHAKPDMIISYNSSTSDWDISYTRSGIVIPSSPYTSMIVVYEGYNNIDSYTWTAKSATSEYYRGKWVSFLEETYTFPLVLYNDYVKYTYSESTLTADISSWTFQSTMKVLIKGLDKTEADDYQLHVWKNSGSSSTDFPCSVKGFSVDFGGFSHLLGKQTGWTGGVPDDEGVAFYYYGPFSCTASDVVHFQIYKDGWADYRWCDITGHEYATTDKCKGIWFDYSKFK